MLKLFRNIRKSLLMENKSSSSPEVSAKAGKYLKYAIGEIVLVMIGILLALQVNNWNINRIDKTREFKYLQNIKMDLQKDLEGLQYNLEFRQKKYQGTKKIINQINGEPIEDLNELAFNVVNTLYEERFQPSNTTYKELVSSGNLNLITNDSIKMLLFELELLYQKNVFGIDHETFDYQEYVSKSLFKNVDMERIIPVFLGEKTIEEQHISEGDFQSLLQNFEYKNGCMVTNWTTLDFIDLYKIMISKSKRLIEFIDMELIQ